MIRKRKFLVLILLLLVLVHPARSFAAEVDADLGAEGNVSGSAKYYQDPSSGAWTQFPIGFANDPSQYKFEMACFDDDNGDLACFRSYGIDCSDGPDGRLVWWLSSLKDDPVPQWARISSSPSCIYSEDPAAFEERLRAAVLSAFQESPIAPGQLSVQPSPHTLIGAHTNVYVEAAEQVFEMNLLGQSIRIVASPTEYTFDYGDGTAYGPARVPGGPLPESRWGEQTATSHAYEGTGDFPVTVTTFFSGEYSVNGGPMVPIDGRAQVTSPAQLLSVWRSESRNVADDCLVNPAGVGC